MKQPISILIAEDNPHFRDQYRKRLVGLDDIRIIGFAETGQQAVDLVIELQPDLLVISLNIKGLNSIKAIEDIMSIRGTPILAMATKDDGEKAKNAIKMGALETLASRHITSKTQHLIKKIRLLAPIRVITRPKRVRTHAKTAPLSLHHLVAIAASTGGPAAIAQILRTLPREWDTPVIIAQHIGQGFVEGMANWLTTTTNRAVIEAQPMTRIEMGRIYLAPSTSHLEVRIGGGFVFRHFQDNDIYRPSCDMLLSSVADVFGRKTIGVILTGMGCDGAEGIKAVKKAGGITIAQDETTSVVFGMPKSAIDLDVVDHILPLDRIATQLTRILGGGGS